MELVYKGPNKMGCTDSHETENDKKHDRPPKMECECLEKCRGKMPIQRFLDIVEEYKDLTSTESLASHENPLANAFELTKDIKESGKNNIELTKELRVLVRKCKQFTVELCDECENVEEIAALLNFDKEKLKKLTQENNSEVVVETLNKAVDAHHIEFVAHRNIQLIINMVIYSNVPKVVNKYFLDGLFVYAIYTLLFPIWVAISFIFPESKFSTWMKTPFVKFISQVSQFCVFLALLVVSSLRDSHEPSVIEYLIFFYVLTMACLEMHEMRLNTINHYFLKWWNWITAIMLILFALSGLFWLMGFAITGAWSNRMPTLRNLREKTGHSLLLLGNSVFSVASVVSVCHLGSLCQVNSVFGPLQLSVYRMFKDIFKFLTIFLGIFFAFTLGVRNLYSYNYSLQHEITQLALNGTETVTVKQNHRLATFGEATQTMFWALFDQTDLNVFETPGEKYNITQATGKVLFGMFSILAVMVGINMLIAMMNNSFEYIAKDEDYLHWKFSRTRMWLEYVWKDSYHLPPPYNIMEMFVCIFKFIFKRVRRAHCSMEVQNEIDDENHDKRKEIVEEITRRYKEKQKDSNETKSKLLEMFKEYCEKMDLQSSKNHNANLPSQLDYISNV